MNNSYSSFCGVTPKGKVSGIKQPHGHVGITVKLYALNFLAAYSFFFSQQIN